ncbi:MAG: membrane-bound PQQ-dependent dehydrogenase, glucose/quinate/shikimate family, partial [Pseudaminobacter sp.]|nr:membrane-bound PQQ-dependent dehydrogenase, glucose/quinate/shikimate family [Pseudaminobacter sp.]
MRWALAAILLLLGLLVGAGGIWLISLGGSWYYILLALGFVLTAALLFRRDRRALVVFALVVAGSLGWAVYEVGLDWWQLAPRGGLIVILGLLLLTPWATRPLDRDDGRRSGVWRGAALPLAASLLASVAVAGYAMTLEPHAIKGQIPDPPTPSLPPSEAVVPPGEWHAYGRTPGGSHYSPLDAITPENVSNLQKVWEYHTGDVRVEGDPEETTYEVTPIMIDDTLYLCTPHQIAIALDPETGEERWRYDSNVGVNSQRQHQSCR